MSNRRRLRPHETARRDQRLAQAEDALRHGTAVIWEDQPPPQGLQCSWCDCQDWQSPSSPHSQPGYVCPFPCPAMSATVVWIMSPADPPKPVPLCQRHRPEFLDDLVDQFPDIELMDPWGDDDL